MRATNLEFVQEETYDEIYHRHGSDGEIESVDSFNLHSCDHHTETNVTNRQSMK